MLHIRGALLRADGKSVVTDFGEYALAGGERVNTQEDLRDILARQYRRWDEDHWKRGGWRGTTREEFEAIADANEARLRSQPIKPDGDPQSLLAKSKSTQ